MKRHICPNCTRLANILSQIIGYSAPSEPAQKMTQNSGSNKSQVADFLTSGLVERHPAIHAVSTTSTVLYRAYLQWMQDAAQPHTMSANRFGRELTALGYPSVRGTNGVRIRRGLTVKTPTV